MRKSIAFSMDALVLHQRLKIALLKRVWSNQGKGPQHGEEGHPKHFFNKSWKYFLFFVRDIEIYGAHSRNASNYCMYSSKSRATPAIRGFEPLL